jgi:hypothetical protein
VRSDTFCSSCCCLRAASDVDGGGELTSKELFFSIDQPGDQIGRILGFGSIVFFGQFYEKCKCTPNFWASFSTAKVMYKV